MAGIKFTPAFSTPSSALASLCVCPSTCPHFPKGCIRLATAPTWWESGTWASAALSVCPLAEDFRAFWVHWLVVETILTSRAVTEQRLVALTCTMVNGQPGSWAGTTPHGCMHRGDAQHFIWRVLIIFVVIIVSDLSLKNYSLLVVLSCS